MRTDRNPATMMDIREAETKKTGAEAPAETHGKQREREEKLFAGVLEQQADQHFVGNFVHIDLILAPGNLLLQGLNLVRAHLRGLFKNVPHLLYFKGTGGELHPVCLAGSGPTRTAGRRAFRSFDLNLFRFYLGKNI
jgi:hypothetical protein